MTAKWIGEAIGVVAVVLSGIIYLQKKRSSIILTKLVTDIFWIFNLVLLGGYTGAVINGIAVVRECVFYQRERHKWADHVAWMYVFMILTLISPVLEWSALGRITALPMLPAVGSMIAVMSFFAKQPRRMRSLGYASQGLWFLYNIRVGNYSGMASNILMSGAALIGNLREARDAKKQGQQNG